MGLANRLRSACSFFGAITIFILPSLLVLPGVLALLVLSGKGVSSPSYYRLQSVFFIDLNDWLSGWPVFWKNVTELGDALIFFPLIAFLIVWSPRTWAALFGAVPLSALLSWAGKTTAVVMRPAAVLGHNKFHIIGKALTGHSSLPSGHTITAVAIVTVMVTSMMTSRENRNDRAWILIGGVLVGGTIGISRVAVGAHWPLDVLVGTCLGIVGGGSGVLLSHRYKSWWTWIERPGGRAAFGLVMLLWGGALVNKSLSENGGGLIVPWIAAFSAIAVGTYLVYDVCHTRLRS